MADREKRTGTTPPTDAPKVALVVLGMHRSGTSALAGVLGQLGARLPKNLIPATENNPAGYFESEVLYRLHDEMLEQAGTRWDDPSPFPARWFGSAAAKTWTRRMVELCRDEFGESDLFVLKDPRICRLVPFWAEVLREIGAEPRYLLAVRNPLETARSVEAAESDPENVARILWLDYFLSAERDTRNRPRCFVAYDALLADWRKTRDTFQQVLGVTLPRTSRGAEAEIDAFVQSELRNQRVTDEELLSNNDVHPWLKNAYAWALEAARGAEPNPKLLDAIQAEMTSAEAAFGPALGSSEVARRTGLTHLEKARTEIEKLTGDIEERKVLEKELRQKIATFRSDAQRTGESNRMLLRWMVDRVRAPDEPAPASLRAVLAAAEKAVPSEIPAIAATGLVLADQKLAIEQLERELRARADRLGELAENAGKHENQLRVRNEIIERERLAQQKLLKECERLTAELENARAGWRYEKARAHGAVADRERLEGECARLLEEASRMLTPEGAPEDR